MKIQDVTSNAAVQGIAVSDKKLAGTKSQEFQNQLERASEQDLEDKLKFLVNKISEQGEKLSKRTDIRELKIYKKLIADFLNEAVSNSHKFNKRNFLDRRGRHRVFANVKKINEELDSLTKEVLESEKDNFKILKKLEDIRGLILDMLI